MRFFAAIGKRIARCKQAARAALSVVALSAVVGAALTLVGKEVLTFRPTLENPEQGKDVFLEPWTLAASASTRSRFQTEAKEAQDVKERLKNTILLADDWKYTSLNADQFAGLEQALLLLEMITDKAMSDNGVDSVSLQQYMLAQSQFNPLFLRLNPSLGQQVTPAQFGQLAQMLFLLEIAGDNALAAHNLDAENLQELIITQLLFNRFFNLLAPSSTPSSSPPPTPPPTPPPSPPISPCS